MTHYQASEYLRRLGNGDEDRGLDIATTETINAGVSIMGSGIYNKAGKPICSAVWYQPYMLQAATVHWYINGCRGLR